MTYSVSGCAFVSLSDSVLVLFFIKKKKINNNIKLSELIFYRNCAFEINNNVKYNWKKLIIKKENKWRSNWLGLRLHLQMKTLSRISNSRSTAQTGSHTVKSSWFLGEIKKHFQIFLNTNDVGQIWLHKWH